MRHQGKSIKNGSRRVEINDAVVLKLGTQPFLFLLFLAERARENDLSLGKYLDAMKPFQQFVTRLRLQWKRKRGAWMVLSKKLLPEGFAECLAKHDDSPIRTKLLWGITQKLRQVPGAAVLEPCLPEPGRCTLDLPPERIEILD